VRRSEAAAAAERISRPIYRADRFIRQWRRISPFVKTALVPTIFLLRRRLGGTKAGGSRTLLLLRWAPMILRAVRLFAQRA
jgi:hypothetical protein